MIWTSFRNFGKNIFSLMLPWHVSGKCVQKILFDFFYWLKQAEIAISRNFCFLEKNWLEIAMQRFGFQMHIIMLWKEHRFSFVKKNFLFWCCESNSFLIAINFINMRSFRDILKSAVESSLTLLSHKIWNCTRLFLLSTQGLPLTETCNQIECNKVYFCSNIQFYQIQVQRFLIKCITHCHITHEVE